MHFFLSDIPEIGPSFFSVVLLPWTFNFDFVVTPPRPFPIVSPLSAACFFHAVLVSHFLGRVLPFSNSFTWLHFPSDVVLLPERWRGSVTPIVFRVRPAILAANFCSCFCSLIVAFFRSYRASADNCDCRCDFLTALTISPTVHRPPPPQFVARTSFPFPF